MNKEQTEELLAGDSYHGPSNERTHAPNQLSDENKSEKGLANVDRGSKLILILCTIANFFSGCSFAIMAPFYPHEAEEKGMSITEIGFIFSIFELIIFAFSPVIGNYLARLGPKRVLLVGIFFGGLCNITFGLLIFCPPGAPYIALSFVTRSIQAFGFCCYVNSSFAIVASEFSSRISTAFGFLQTATGTGLMVGPVIGGGLYELGGFGLPFYFIGTSVILNGMIVYCILPPPTKIPDKRKGSIFTLMKSPMVSIPMFCICTGALGLTFLEPVLAKHLEPFGLSTGIIGLFFVVSPLVHAVFSPLWGYVTDTKDIQAPFLVSAHLVNGLGYFIIGPTALLPFLPFEIWSVLVGLVLVGLSFSCIMITAMKCMVKGAIELGFKEGLDTYALVSSIFNSLYTLGGFVGPMLGGILSEKYGQSFGFTVVGLLSGALMTTVTLVFFLIRSSCCVCRGNAFNYVPIIGK